MGREQAPTYNGAEGSKEEMAPKLESEINTARSRASKFVPKNHAAGGSGQGM